MKKLVLLLVLITLSGCGFVNWAFGIDDQGNKVDPTPPVFYLTEVLKSLGPLGIAATGAISVAGAGYIGSKKGDGVLTGIVAGIQKAKDAMSEDDKNALVAKLSKHIPTKYHAKIKKIKDSL